MYKNTLRDLFNPGTDLTANATADVAGKTFVTYSGDMDNGLVSVKPAGASDVVAGVAKYDAKAGELVGVARGASRVLTVTAGSALTAGTPVAPDANGKAVAATGTAYGVAVSDAAANTDVYVSLNQ